VLAALAGFDLAIFVSPQAARATAALLAQPWPAGTAMRQSRRHARCAA